MIKMTFALKLCSQQKEKKTHERKKFHKTTNISTIF